MTVLDVLNAHGIPYDHKETENVYIDCPECGKLNLSISIFSGVWHCWTTDCEEKGFRGVFPLLADKLKITLTEPLSTSSPPPKNTSLSEEDAKAIIMSNGNKPEVIEFAVSRGLDPSFVLAQGVGYEPKVKAIVLPFRTPTGELIGAKYRGLNGDQWIKGKQPDLYLLDPTDLAKEKVIVVEGEIDALTLKQLGIPCVATLGAGKDRGLGLLAKCRQIYLGYDMDAPGEAGVEKAVLALGRQRCKRIRWLDKDPNDMLKAGATPEQILQCIKDATSLSDTIKSKNARDTLMSYITGLEKAPLRRRSWGYPRLDSFTKGLGGGEFIGVLAEAGTGKTTFVLQVVANLLDQGYRCGIGSLEEHIENEITPKLFSTIIGRNIGMGGLTREEAERHAERMSKVQLYPGDGELNDVVDWVRECYYVHDVKFIAIDYLQLMCADEKDVQQIKDICYTFKKLVKECPELTILMVIQPKQKQRTRLKDGSEAAGLKLEGADARGGSAINQSVDKMLTITGVANEPNLTQYEYTKVRGHLNVSKREWLNKFTQLEYDHATLRMREVEHLRYGGAG